MLLRWSSLGGSSGFRTRPETVEERRESASICHVAFGARSMFTRAVLSRWCDRTGTFMLSLWTGDHVDADGGRKARSGWVECCVSVCVGLSPNMQRNTDKHINTHSFHLSACRTNYGDGIRIKMRTKTLLQWQQTTKQMTGETKLHAPVGNSCF